MKEFQYELKLYFRKSCNFMSPKRVTAKRFPSPLTRCFIKILTTSNMYPFGKVVRLYKNGKLLKYTFSRFYYYRVDMVDILLKELEN